MYMYILALLALLWSVAVQANELVAVKTLRCSFDVGFTAEYNDKLKVKNVEKDQKPFSDTDIVYDSIDPKSGTARVIGRIGTETVAILLGDKVIHFLEITETGNLVATSVFQIENAKAYPVIMSRHIGSILGDDSPIISQNFGTCVALD